MPQKCLFSLFCYWHTLFISPAIPKSFTYPLSCLFILSLTQTLFIHLPNTKSIPLSLSTRQLSCSYPLLCLSHIHVHTMSIPVSHIPKSSPLCLPADLAGIRETHMLLLIKLAKPQTVSPLGGMMGDRWTVWGMIKRWELWKEKNIRQVGGGVMTDGWIEGWIIFLAYSSWKKLAVFAGK